MRKKFAGNLKVPYASLELQNVLYKPNVLILKTNNSRKKPNKQTNKK